LYGDILETVFRIANVADDAPLDVALKAFATAILNGDAVLDSMDLGVAVVGVLAECEARLGS